MPNPLARATHQFGAQSERSADDYLHMFARLGMRVKRHDEITDERALAELKSGYQVDVRFKDAKASRLAVRWMGVALTIEH